jgi:hypothetical protein
LIFIIVFRWDRFEKDAPPLEAGER